MPIYANILADIQDFKQYLPVTDLADIYLADNRYQYAATDIKMVDIDITVCNNACKHNLNYVYVWDRQVLDRHVLDRVGGP